MWPEWHPCLNPDLRGNAFSFSLLSMLLAGCHQLLSVQGESQLPPASPGGSPRSLNGSDPDTFQTAASALGLGASEVLCAPFKSGVFVS